MPSTPDSRIHRQYSCVMLVSRLHVSLTSNAQPVELAGAGQASAGLGTRNALGFANPHGWFVGKPRKWPVIRCYRHLFGNGSAPHYRSRQITTAAAFAIASKNCGTSLAAGVRCTVGVAFSPTTTGRVTGTLTFTDNGEQSAYGELVRHAAIARTEHPEG